MFYPMWRNDSNRFSLLYMFYLCFLYNLNGFPITKKIYLLCAINQSINQSNKQKTGNPEAVALAKKLIQDKVAEGNVHVIINLFFIFILWEINGERERDREKERKKEFFFSFAERNDKSMSTKPQIAKEKLYNIYLSDMIFF